MMEKVFHTPKGDIHYWTHGAPMTERPTLVFLPGLTADHRLFDKQIEYFREDYHVLVWDAPGHAASWPFTLDFTLMDKARWLGDILTREGVERFVIVGQSMGGYVGQAFAQRFPGRMSGFVCIDSAPLQRHYVTGIEIWLLKRMEPVYRWYPWKRLLIDGTKGCATSDYGVKLMHDIMMVYDGDKERYSKLSGHGFKMIAEAMEADLPYELNCPSLLICGTKDMAGSAKSYNKRWHKHTGIPLEWIEGAGHNSNTDRPETVNRLIEEFIETNVI